MTEKETQKFKNSFNTLNELATKSAEFISKNGSGNLIDIEYFIVKLMLNFDIDYYQSIGILEEAKNAYRDITLNGEEEDE